MGHSRSLGEFDLQSEFPSDKAVKRWWNGILRLNLNAQECYVLQD